MTWPLQNQSRLPFPASALRYSELHYLDFLSVKDENQYPISWSCSMLPIYTRREYSPMYTATQTFQTREIVFLYLWHDPSRVCLEPLRRCLYQRRISGKFLIEA